MSLKIIFNEFNEDEETLRFYVSASPMDINNLPTPVDETGDSSTLTPEPDYGPDAVSHTVSWNEQIDAYVRVSSVRSGVESVSDEWFYAAPMQIGIEFGGGIYAGTHTNGTEAWHVIFAKQDSEADGTRWGNNGTKTGATDPDDGLANQNLILASFDDGAVGAFYHCRDYVDAEGNNDYYLPARNELALVDTLVDMSHAEFSTDLSAYRRSSTEAGSLSAWARRFSDGYENSYTKKYNAAIRVRPVRRVLVEH